MADYIQKFHRYGKQLWITEFSCGSTVKYSVEKNLEYMLDAIPILEKDPFVFREYFVGEG